MIPWTHPSPQPKRHLDRFSRFAGLTSVTDRQTTLLVRYNNRPYLRTYGRCGLIIITLLLHISQASPKADLLFSTGVRPFIPAVPKRQKARCSRCEKCGLHYCVTRPHATMQINSTVSHASCLLTEAISTSIFKAAIRIVCSDNSPTRPCPLGQKLQEKHPPVIMDTALSVAEDEVRTGGFREYVSAATV